MLTIHPVAQSDPESAQFWYKNQRMGAITIPSLYKNAFKDASFYIKAEKITATSCRKNQVQAGAVAIPKDEKKSYTVVADPTNYKEEPMELDLASEEENSTDDTNDKENKAQNDFNTPAIAKLEIGNL